MRTAFDRAMGGLPGKALVTPGESGPYPTISRELLMPRGRVDASGMSKARNGAGGPLVALPTHSPRPQDLAILPTSLCNPMREQRPGRSIHRVTLR